MGKKSKKRNVAPKKARPTMKESKPNPFEMRFNKQRHSVLGRHVKKGGGMPGLSRAKAVNKREQTLLKEYKDLHKMNSFVDRRIGENDAATDPDERALARFAKEWRKNKKNTMFNLNDEDLTHMGRSLSEIDDFQHNVSDSEDENANLSGDFIKKAHFGGFMTLKSANYVEPEKSHKEMMQELIMETKKQKYERQSEKEANVNLTDKLDEEWKLLQSLVKKSKSTANLETNKTDNSYDMAVKSLKFEVKGKPTDRLKTEDEIAKETKEKLNRLEADRQKRMMGEKEVSRLKTIHISADSLDDGLALDENENSASGDEMIEKKGNEGDHSDDREDDNEREDDDINEEEDNEDQEDNHADDSDAESSSSGENIYTGMFSDESDSEDNFENDEQDKKTPITKHLKKKQVSKEIPSDLEELFMMFSDQSTLQRKQTLESLIKNNRSNITKMENLYSILLEYLTRICTKDHFDSSMIDALIPVMYELVQMSSCSMSGSLLNLLAEKRKQFLKNSKKVGRKIPGLETLILFKLVSNLYPTSDFQHSMVIGSELFMSEILDFAQITTKQDVVRGLFISNLFLEYVSYAKRFVPEAVSFLQKLLNKEIQNVPLKFLSDTEGNDVERMPLNWLVEGTEIPSDSKTSVQMLSCCIHLLKEFAKLYIDLPSFDEVFVGMKAKLDSLMSHNIFSVLKDEIQDLQDVISKKPPKKVPLIEGQKKVKCLKMYEPRLQADFTGKKQRLVMSAKKAERQKLLYKYKEEFKGAVREIRRDNEYVSRVQFNEQMERDNERKQKLKRLYQDLAEQEGDFKRYKKRRR